MTGKRPYRCKGCAWRGWGVDSGPKFHGHDVEIAAQALAPEPPNLDSADTVLAREEKPEEIDLKQLEFEIIEEESR
jgi:hypothetical protein